MRANVPLEDETNIFRRWLQENRLRGKDWRQANLEISGYWINEFGDMVSMRKSKRHCHLMKRQTYRQGYQYYSICTSKNRSLKVKVHRVVAMTFIPNPRGVPMVNHKNGIKNDNRVSNLEWVTGSENMLHAYRKLGFKSQGGVERKRIKCVETGIVYNSVREAARAIGSGTSNTSVSGAAKGRIAKSKGHKYKIRTCGGYHWRFV